jgi:hypothetical protein
VLVRIYPSSFSCFQLNANGEIQIDIRDPELRRQLSLTTADLRFIDYIVKTVTGGNDDDTNTEHDGNELPRDTSIISFTDGTEWEGGDEWIRLQFRAYLLSLIATAQMVSFVCLVAEFNYFQEETPQTTQSSSHPTNDFNDVFVSAWRRTYNYRVVVSNKYEDLNSAVPG